MRERTRSYVTEQNTDNCAADPLRISHQQYTVNQCNKNLSAIVVVLHQTTTRLRRSRNKKQQSVIALLFLGYLIKSYSASSAVRVIVIAEEFVFVSES